jgi:hypothetical protein
MVHNLLLIYLYPVIQSFATLLEMYLSSEASAWQFPLILQLYLLFFKHLIGYDGKLEN